MITYICYIQQYCSSNFKSQQTFVLKRSVEIKVFTCFHLPDMRSEFLVKNFGECLILFSEYFLLYYFQLYIVSEIMFYLILNELVLKLNSDSE
jgi:hypothetical protein